MTFKPISFAALVSAAFFAPLFSSQKRLALQAMPLAQSTSSATSGTAASVGTVTLVAANQLKKKNSTQWQTEKKREHVIKYTASPYLKVVRKELYDLLDPLPNELIVLIVGYVQKKPTQWQTEKKREHALKYTSVRYLKALHKELYDLLDPLPNDLIALIIGYVKYQRYTFAGEKCSYEIYPTPSRNQIDTLVALGSRSFASTEGRVIKVFTEGKDKLWECAQKLKGHTDQIFALAFLEKNNVLVSGSCDTTIKIWAKNPNGTFQPKAQQTLDEEDADGHSDDVNALQALLNGQFASGSSDGTIKLWRRNDKSGHWECAQTLHGHGDGFTVERLALLNSGELASGAHNSCSRDVIKIWDIDRCTCVCSETFSGIALRSMAVASDGGLFCGGTDGVTLWKLRESKSLEKTLTCEGTVLDVSCVSSDCGCDSELSSMALLPNGHLLAFTDNGVMVTANPREKLVFGECGDVWPQGFDDDEHLFSWSDVIRGEYILEKHCVEKPQEERPQTSLRKFAGHSGGPQDPDSENHVPCCILLSDGRVVSCSMQGTILVWN